MFLSNRKIVKKKSRTCYFIPDIVEKACHFPQCYHRLGPYFFHYIFEQKYLISYLFIAVIKACKC